MGGVVLCPTLPTLTPIPRLALPLSPPQSPRLPPPMPQTFTPPSHHAPRAKGRGGGGASSNGGPQSSSFVSSLTRAGSVKVEHGGAVPQSTRKISPNDVTAFPPSTPHKGGYRR